jgi:hypothetical protein
LGRAGDEYWCGQGADIMQESHRARQKLCASLLNCEFSWVLCVRSFSAVSGKKNFLHKRFK